MEEPIRSTRRFRVALPLWIRFRQGSKKGKRTRQPEPVAESTITENISTTGCYFFVSQKPAVGTRAELEVTIPGRPAGMEDGRVRAHGKVIRVDEEVPNGRIGVACSIDCYEFSGPNQS